MIKATVLNGSEFTYTSKRTGNKETGFNIWFTLESSPYSFKLGFFNPADIEKAKAAAASGKAELEIVPDRNVSPVFVLK